jgi:hypothetical protein
LVTFAPRKLSILASTDQIEILKIACLFWKAL